MISDSFLSPGDKPSAIEIAKKYKGIRPDYAAPGAPTGFEWFTNVYATSANRYDSTYEYFLGEPRGESLSPDQLMGMGMIGVYRRKKLTIQFVNILPDS
jgi:hypothetical protein